MKLGFKVLSVVLTGATVFGIYQSVNSKTELGKDSFLIKDQEIAGLMDDQQVIDDESACISEVSDGNDLYEMSDTTATDMTEDMASEPTATDMTEDMIAESGESKNTTVKQGC